MRSRADIPAMIALGLIGAIGLSQGCSSENDTGENLVGLSLAVAPGKSVYRPGEPIAVTIMLTNDSQAPIAVNQRIDFPRPELSLEIIDDSGKRLQWMPPIPPAQLREHDFDVLTSEESLATTIDDIARLLSKPPATGTYTLRAIYRNVASGTEFGIDAWTGELASKSSQFEIRPRS